MAGLTDLLQWHVDAGVDETIGEMPVNHFLVRQAVLEEAQSQAMPVKAILLKESKPSVSLAAAPPEEAAAEARTLADKATTRAELEEFVRAFEGCAIKKMAMNTVFSDGNPNAEIMLIGEAPGAQEDQQGIPFCGASGQLLDKMLAAINLSRKEHVYITNTIFWRPPGNRQPSKEELAICRPFVERHIALMNPRLLILSGGTAVGSLLRKDVGITKLRGRFHAYQNAYMQKSVPAAILFHPSYLLRSPGQKRLAWHDLLLIRQFVDNQQ